MSKSYLQTLEEDYLRIEHENQRYKEALEDIKINSRSDVNRAIEKACKALEGESK